jgi:hypothetical protein
VCIGIAEISPIADFWTHSQRSGMVLGNEHCEQVPQIASVSLLCEVVQAHLLLLFSFKRRPKLERETRKLRSSLCSRSSISVIWNQTIKFKKLGFFIYNTEKNFQTKRWVNVKTLLAGCGGVLL